MYKIETSIELPIAHCLYKGAYSGLCCGNVDRNNHKYDLGDKIFPIIHGHNYNVKVSLCCEELDKNKMVIDFKKMKEIIHNLLDKYDHSMILTEDNPLLKAYKINFKKNGIDINKTRLFIWNENPTAESMAQLWQTQLLFQFRANKLNVSKLLITVEETKHNSVTYCEGDYYHDSI